jgi:hypothetical protein
MKTLPHSPTALTEAELDQVSGGAIGNIISSTVQEFPGSPIRAEQVQLALTLFPGGPIRGSVGGGT